MMVTLTGSGPLDEEEKLTLRKLARQFNVSKGQTEAVIGTSFTPLNANSLLFSDSYDPCTSALPLGGVYCELGHVVALFWSYLNLVGTIPDLQALTKLRHLELRKNSLTGPLTTTPTNEVVWPDMVLIDISYNQITAIPNSLFGPQSKLSFLDATSCSIQYIPPSLNETRNLATLILFNNLIPSFPSLASLVNLQFLDLSYNNATIQMSSFNQLSSIRSILLSYNTAVGCLSADWFDNLPFLTFLYLDSMNLCGVLPTFNNSLYVQHVELQNNHLQGTVPGAWLLPPFFNKIVLTGNRLQIHENSFPASVETLLLGSTGIVYRGSSVCSFMLSFVPVNIVTLGLENNDIGGQFHVGECQPFSRLTTLNMSHTSVENIPPDLFMSTFSPAIQSLDLSYSSTLPTYTGLCGYLLFFFPELNCSLPVVTPLPAIQFLSFIGNPNLSGALPSWLSLSSAVLSTVQNAPNVLCGQLSTSLSTVQLMLDPTYYSFRGCQCFNGYFGTPPSCNLIPPLVDAPGTLFSDSQFGDQRYSSGLDSSWLISPGASVRVITLNITMYSVFNQVTDQLTFFASSNASSLAIFTLPNDDYPLLPLGSGDTYSSNSVTRNVILTVYSNVVLVNFRSRSTNGKHWSLEYKVSQQCPDKYMFYNQKCEPLAFASSTYQRVVYLISAFVSLFIICVAVVIMIYYNSLVVRSSSGPFSMAMLVFLLIMSTGSVFFALQPADSSITCHGRAWFTGSSVVGLLATLLTKANRIRNIFDSSNLRESIQSNADLAFTIFIMLSVEFLLLIVFSSTSMSSSIASSSKNNENVNIQCMGPQDTNAYMAWLIVHFVYISLFLISGLVIAVGIRKVPVAYNESSHIVNCFVSFLSLGFIIVLVQFIIYDIDGLLILRGVGQSMVALVLTLALFGPKLYYLADGRANDRSLIKDSSLEKLGVRSNETPNKRSPAASKSGSHPYSNPDVMNQIKRLTLAGDLDGLKKLLQLPLSASGSDVGSSSGPVTHAGSLSFGPRARGHSSKLSLSLTTTANTGTGTGTGTGAATSTSMSKDTTVMSPLTSIISNSNLELQQRTQTTVHAHTDASQPNQNQEGASFFQHQRAPSEQTVLLHLQ